MHLSTRIKDRPIGVFDSGLGGLTVLKALMEELPEEDFIYLGDTARLPYGTKSKSTVTQYVQKAIRFFESQNCKAIVLDCNTACALSFSEMRTATSLPIFSILEAGVEASLEASDNKKILVLATYATVRSEAYLKAFYKKDPTVKIDQLACPLLVPLAEEGWFDHPTTVMVVGEYLRQLRSFDFDLVLLGCTHYPLLIPSLQKEKILEGKRLIHGGKKLAVFLMETIERQERNRTGKVKLFATDISDFQTKIVNQSFGPSTRGNQSFEFIDINA